MLTEIEKEDTAIVKPEIEKPEHRRRPRRN